DNFEQVLAAAPMISEMLEAAPRIKVVITSRALLNLRGEHEYQVPTLQLPDDGETRSVRQMADCESVSMFVGRVRALDPRFNLDERNAPTIVEICRRLDGLPLAIELAAARVKLLSLDGLLAMLSSRLKLLTGGGRDLPLRQQTLRNTLEWSVQLLNENDQKLFARLGVFLGGFSLESAQEVCHTIDDSDSDILLGVESLLNNSLIQAEQLDMPGPRFHMLETIREYAEEKLAERGELETMQRRHAQYFIDKTNATGPVFNTREAEQGLAWVDLEHDNLRAALSCCFREPSLLGLAPWLLTAMNWPWYRRGFLSEGRQWANRLLNSPITGEQPLARCYALWSSGAMAMWQGDLNEALALLEQAVMLAKSIESPMSIGVTALFLGTTLVNRGEDETALQYLQEAKQIFEQLAMPWYLAITQVHMANATLGMGDIQKARSYLDQTLPISQQIGENWLISFIMNNYGEMARIEGDYRKAQQYYAESEGLLRAMGDKGDLARLVHNLGCVALHTGDLPVAESRFKESLAMFIKLGNPRGIAECLASVGGLWSHGENIQPAVKILAAAHALLDKTGAKWWPADRGEVESHLQKLQERIEPSEFNSAWQSGQNMSLEQASSYAQRQGSQG
ncbi:MAG: ATP-binding protein, partial [Acidobacteriaceae bacterium]